MSLNRPIWGGPKFGTGGGRVSPGCLPPRTVEGPPCASSFLPAEPAFSAQSNIWHAQTFSKAVCVLNSGDLPRSMWMAATKTVLRVPQPYKRLRAMSVEHSLCLHSLFPSIWVPGFIPCTRLQTSPSRLDPGHFVKVRLANPGPIFHPPPPPPFPATSG